MPEIYTYTGRRLATAVKEKFGDTGAVQVTDTMILNWINDGVRSITAQVPYLEKSAKANLLAGTANYSLQDDFTPAPRIAEWTMVTLQGAPLKFHPFSEWQQLIGGRRVEDRTGHPEFYTEYGGDLILWPAPIESVADGIVIYYRAYPDDIDNLDDPLPVPDRFYNSLLDYVHAQALELDDNFEAARVKLGHHETHLQRQFEKENKSPTDFYPAITYDPYDEDLPGNNSIGGNVTVNNIIGGGYGGGGYGS